MNANIVIAKQQACLVVVEEGTKKLATGSLYIGVQFQNLDVVWAMARAEAIKSHVELMNAKSDCSRYTVVCRTDGCMWRLVPSRPACEVKNFHDVHNCGGVSQLGNKEATAEWVASKYMEKFRDHAMLLEGKAGFSHCRALIGFDGTFLTSKYLGALLTATWIDAMGALFPIAFGLVDAENEDNWVWFLQNLHENLANVNGLCFISDKQKGLLPAVELVFLGCEYAYCMRHLDANLKKKCNNGEFIRLFWVAAYAITVAGYEETIKGMKAISDLATTYLLNTSPPSHWATAHFKGKRYGHLTSNIAESLNAWLLEARDKPVIAMLDIIRRQLTAWIYARKTEGINAWESLGDRAEFALVSNVEKNLRDIGNHARQ
ncbi:hypothetical protein L7F22_008296 [Adiantum nelumboides]|nr:hypothetical protein [Adiantum nelumboides]